MKKYSSPLTASEKARLRNAFDVLHPMHRRPENKIYRVYYDRDVTEVWYFVATSKPEAIQIAREYGYRFLDKQLWLVYYERRVVAPSPKDSKSQVPVLELDEQVKGR